MLLSVQNFESNPEVAKLAIHNQSAPILPNPCSHPHCPGEPPDHRPQRRPHPPRRGLRGRDLTPQRQSSMCLLWLVYDMVSNFGCI